MRLCLTLSLLLIFGLAVGVAPSAMAQTSSEAAAQHQSGQNRAAYTLPPDKLKTAIEYTRKRTILGFAETGWQILQLVLLLTLGVAAWMQRVAIRAARNRWTQGYIFFFFFIAITSLLSLPLEMYSQHVSVAYGQSVQHWEAGSPIRARDLCSPICWAGCCSCCSFLLCAGRRSIGGSGSGFLL